MQDTDTLKALIIRFEAHPLLSTAKLGISVEDGIAVLSGHVVNGTVKVVAEMLCLEAPCVRAVANEIETVPEETWRYVDCRIAKQACDLLEWNSLVPAELKVRVEHGRMSISGKVTDMQTFDRISSMLRDFSGARSIDNHLRVEPPSALGNNGLSIGGESYEIRPALSS